MEAGTGKEEYDRLKKQLKVLLNRRKNLRKDLDAVEENIYIDETTYLQDAVSGNIAKGFENYTKSAQNRRRQNLTDQDRIFSQSSTLFTENAGDQA